MPEALNNKNPPSPAHIGDLLRSARIVASSCNPFYANYFRHRIDAWFARQPATDTAMGRREAVRRALRIMQDLIAILPTADGEIPTR